MGDATPLGLCLLSYKMRTALPTSWGVLLWGLNEVQPLPDTAEGQYKIILLGQKLLAQALQIV